jgi:hypothetical protein
VVLAGFTQQVKHEAERQRYEHNQRVLREAKQALLMYAYRYPNIALTFNGSVRGPGRLPCPDIDNSGTPNPAANCVDGSGDGLVGRFPWNANGMEFYDARDAAGERLWYAVAGNFSNFNSATVINSDDRGEGSISLFDQSGRLLYDGSASGIAAVIIAPGSVVRRDEDAPPDGVYEYAQVRQTASQQGDPRNYLDTFGDYDNSRFVNGSAANGDGFILGPIFDTAVGDTVVNDQIIIVTADEIVDMAEKKVLETYRDSIRRYLQMAGNCSAPLAAPPGTTEQRCVAAGGIWTPVYPWLFNYQGITYTGAGETLDDAIAKLSNYFPYDTDWSGGTNYHDDNGRIPSIFGNYFTDGSPGIALETRLEGTIRLINPVSNSDSVFFIEADCNDPPCPSDQTANGIPTHVDGFQTLTLDPLVGADDAPKLDFTVNQGVTVNLEDLPGTGGRIAVNFPMPETFTYQVYFWDEDNDPTGTFTACDAGANEVSDCSRTGSVGNYSYIAGSPNDLKARILHMTVDLTFSGTVNFDVDYATPPTITITPPTANSHARIRARFPAASVTAVGGVLNADYEFERHWHETEDEKDWPNTGDNSYSWGTVDMSGFSHGDLELEMTYFPELPQWTYDNEWHNAIRMAYAPDYAPGVLPPGCDPVPLSLGGDDDCLKINPDVGGPRNIKSLLVLAGEHDWDDINANGWLGNSDDLQTVFDNGNHNGNYTYYTTRGNDRVLFIEKLP